ncbi:WD40/YVTN/BNR-like repeat-containing protein [Nocardia cyriacigeorgica]|uniref:Exo-alpha-sialidase n=1 Tax=Nocardia cyriacigeorgica TaxID=135487 RepID=A0A5R8NQ15_9NOCA|nr:sialidase family protein [Nocardia cyriacigeorgica]TLF76757.1 exo-alpha-sialidase [Nocardia cyriacigeorgica]
MDVMLGIGTRKGLFLARSIDGRSSWEVSTPQFPVADVKALAIDTRGPRPRLLTGVLNSHFGPTMVSSDDLGETWTEPDDAPLAFPEDTGAALEGVWQIAPATANEPDVVYAGVEPAALFRSTDGGRTFELVRGLWEHPHRPQWQPGGGGLALHTILTHPSDTRRLAVAISTGGVYQSADGGASWTPTNKGVTADFMPDEVPEWGQCVHKVARDAQTPSTLYLQNHGGVFRSVDDGLSWQRIDGGLPPSNFGFPIVAHPRRPGVIYTFPLDAEMERFRFPPDARFAVYRSEDGGDTWSAQTDGLPQVPFWAAVMRDAMCADDADPAGIYVGTRNGEVYCSPDEGDHWQLVADKLPDVLCVRAAVIG